MSRSPRLTGEQLIEALRQAGFRVVRIRGSHHFIAHEDGRRTVVPVHRGEVIGPGLLHKIVRDCGLTTEDIRRLLGYE